MNMIFNDLKPIKISCRELNSVYSFCSRSRDRQNFKVILVRLLKFFLFVSLSVLVDDC
jgi:hypothetical protein